MLSINERRARYCIVEKESTLAQITTIDRDENTVVALRHSRLVNSSPIYYGWVIMAASVIGRIMTSSILWAR